MGYPSPKALEMAVKDAAKASPLETNRAIAGFYFHRLLYRVFSEPGTPFVLKGGQGMLARTADARATRDIDLATDSLDVDAAMDELKRLAAKDGDDFVIFEFKGAAPIKGEDEYRDGYTVAFDAFIGPKRAQRVGARAVRRQTGPCCRRRVSVQAGCSTPRIYSPCQRHLLPITGYQGGSHFLATNWLPPRTGIPWGFLGRGGMGWYEMDEGAQFGNTGTVEWE